MGAFTPLYTKGNLVDPAAGAIVVRRTRRDGDAVANDDGVFSYEDFFDNKTHDALAFGDASANEV
jgi:hypothetical protein